MNIELNNPMHYSIFLLMFIACLLTKQLAYMLISRSRTKNEIMELSIYLGLIVAIIIFMVALKNNIF